MCIYTYLRDWDCLSLAFWTLVGESYKNSTSVQGTIQQVQHLKCSDLLYQSQNREWIQAGASGEDLKWTWENGVLFAGRDAGRNSMIKGSSWRRQIMLVEEVPTIGPMKRQQANYRGLGSQESMLEAKLLFSCNNLWQFSFFPFHHFRILVSSISICCPPHHQNCYQERANIDDLWLGENGRQLIFHFIPCLNYRVRHFFLLEIQKSKWGETTSPSWQKASVIERISEIQSVRWFILSLKQVIQPLCISVSLSHSRKILLDLHHRTVYLKHMKQLT